MFPQKSDNSMSAALLYGFVDILDENCPRIKISVIADTEIEKVTLDFHQVRGNIFVQTQLNQV